MSPYKLSTIFLCPTPPICLGLYFATASCQPDDTYKL